eukprot:745722-Hanusia_phi.AAC.1
MGPGGGTYLGGVGPPGAFELLSEYGTETGSSRGGTTAPLAGVGKAARAKLMTNVDTCLGLRWAVVKRVIHRGGSFGWKTKATRGGSVALESASPF